MSRASSRGERQRCRQFISPERSSNLLIRCGCDMIELVAGTNFQSSMEVWKMIERDMSGDVDRMINEGCPNCQDPGETNAQREVFSVHRKSVALIAGFNFLGRRVRVFAGMHSVRRQARRVHKHVANGRVLASRKLRKKSKRG